MSKPWKCFFDGASRGNPGPAGWGIAIYHHGVLVNSDCGHLGSMTNNQAEHYAAMMGLRSLRHMKASNCEILGDSKLVINQLSGAWRVNEPQLKRLVDTTRTYLETQDVFTWIPRHGNSEADALANQGVDQGRSEVTTITTPPDVNAHINWMLHPLTHQPLNFILGGAPSRRSHPEPYHCAQLRVDLRAESSPDPGCIHLGILKGGVPPLNPFRDLIQTLRVHLARGTQIYLYSQNGYGRVSIVAITLGCVHWGLSLQESLDWVTQAIDTRVSRQQETIQGIHKVPIPETLAQKEFLESLLCDQARLVSSQVG